MPDQRTSDYEQMTVGVTSSGGFPLLMTTPFRHRLSDQEKDALLTEQAALIERQAGRIAELEALLGEAEEDVAEQKAGAVSTYSRSPFAEHSRRYPNLFITITS